MKLHQFLQNTNQLYKILKGSKLKKLINAFYNLCTNRTWLLTNCFIQTRHPTSDFFCFPHMHCNDLRLSHFAAWSIHSENTSLLFCSPERKTVECLEK